MIPLHDAQQSSLLFDTVRLKNGFLNNVFVNKSYSLYCRKKQSEHLCQSVPRHLPLNRILWWTVPTLINMVRRRFFILVTYIWPTEWSYSFILLLCILSTENNNNVERNSKRIRVMHRKPVQNHVMKPWSHPGHDVIPLKEFYIVFRLLERVGIQIETGWLYQKLH